MIRLLRNYIFWSYERGSLHYDVMVTAIMVFVFVAPQFIDFKDTPVKTVPLHSSEVLVKSAGQQTAERRSSMKFVRTILAARRPSEDQGGVAAGD